MTPATVDDARTANGPTDDHNRRDFVWLGLIWRSGLGWFDASPSPLARNKRAGQ